KSKRNTDKDNTITMHTRQRYLPSTDDSYISSKIISSSNNTADWIKEHMDNAGIDTSYTNLNQFEQLQVRKQ
ncbi:hypothetical protein A0J61_10711, partial [Choanephora cucurbitarum]